MFDEHLNSLYFVLNPLCNHGFFMLIYSIFWLILKFCKYTDEKWQLGQKSGDSELNRLKLKIASSKLAQAKYSEHAEN